MQTVSFRQKILVRSVQAAVGLIVFSFGVYLTIQASIGLSPWDVLVMGIAQRVGVLYGTVALVISLLLLTVDLLMKEKIGIGSILDALICGKAVDLFNWLELVPEQTVLWRGVIMLAAGLLIMAAGQWI